MEIGVGRNGEGKGWSRVGSGVGALVQDVSMDVLHCPLMELVGLALEELMLKDLKGMLVCLLSQ